MNEELANNNENSTTQDNDTPISDKYLYTYRYDKFELVNLKEEDNNNYLNKDQIMNSITCSKCRWPLVKSYKYEPNKELVTMFNAKCVALYCDKLLTSELVRYRFIFIIIAKVLWFKIIRMNQKKDLVEGDNR